MVTIMDENKVIGNVAITSLVGIFSLYALQHVLAAFAPVKEEVVAPEQYGILYLSPAGYIMNVSYGVGEEPVYFGEAVPGTANDVIGWRIYRYEYSVIDDDLEVIGIRFASGNTSFDKVWDDREEYEYS